MGLNFTASGPLMKNVDLNTGAILSSSRVVSESPIDEGAGNFTSNDQSFDRSGRLGLNWRPNSLLTISTNGALRRGVLQRPETIFDQSTGQPTTVSEQVTTDAQNGDVSLRFAAPWGGNFSATGRLNNTEILYDAENVATCQLVKPDNFLKFEFLSFGI